jgi:WD40 repeat protein
VNVGVYGLAICKVNDLIATGGNDFKINIFNKKSNQFEKKIESHTKYVRSVCFSKDGEYLVSGACDNTVKLFKTKDWSMI